MNTRQITIGLLAFAALIPLSAMAYAPLEAAPPQRASPPVSMAMPGDGFSPNAPLSLQSSSAYTWFLPIILLPSTYAITGQVTFQSNPLVDVTITIGAGVTTTTNVSGTYTIRLTEGVYTLTPAKDGYVFIPAFRAVTLNANVSGQNFTATLQPYSVSGKATDGADPVAGVVISAGGTFSATTNSSGNYTLNNLIIGTYTLTATKPGFVFPLRVVTVPPSQAGINFARSTIQVTNPRGMVSDGARNHLFVANAQGNATISVLTETAGLLSPLATIPLGQSPATGVGLLNGKVYAVNWGTLSSPSNVSVIDAATLVKIKDISISACGGDAANLAVNPATGHIFVTLHAGLGQVALIDTNADSVTCIPTNAGAFGVAVHAASNSIFVGNRDGLDLWRVDGATNIAARVVDWRTPTNGGSPYHVSVSPATNRLFVMVGLPNADVPDQLFVYNIGSSGELTPTVGSPVTVGNTGDGGYVLQSQSVCPSAPHLIYIAANALNEVWVLNSDLSLRKRLTSADGIGKKPLALTENTALKQIYIANAQSNTINLLNACDATPLR